MFKYIIVLLSFSISLFATTEGNPDLTYTWIGFTTLIIFVSGCNFGMK